MKIKFQKINYHREIQKILKQIQIIEKKIQLEKKSLEDPQLYKNDKLKFEEVVNKISNYEKNLQLLEKEWIFLEEQNMIN